jgi:hypothetical protein
MVKYIRELKHGDLFSKLTFIEQSSTESNKIGRYLCQCGKEIECKNRSVIDGNKKSCGCSSTYTIRHENEELLGGKVGLSYILNRTKQRCNRPNKRVIQFDIVIDDLVAQWDSQNGKCVYTGVELKLKSFSQEYYLENQASLDRIDSNLGYTRDNIQFVSKDINFMKIDLCESEFVELCGLIADNF